MNYRALVYCILALSITESVSCKQERVLQLRQAKDERGSLRVDFLRYLVELFDVDTFIETGTYLGDTTHNAAACFKQVHTIELSPDLYVRARNRFRSIPSVHAYCGDSPHILKNIVSSIQGTMIFWLDGHYSGGNTAKARGNTPIVQELEVLRASGITDAIILIDDLRLFQGVSSGSVESLTGYPTVKELQELILAINRNYVFVVYGDIALAYPRQETIVVSPLLEALTASRLHMCDTIACVTAQEEEVMRQLAETYASQEYAVGSEYALWYGLILMQHDKYDEAMGQFKKACACAVSGT